MITELWNLLIVNPLLNTLVFIYSVVGSYGVAIIIFTLLMKLITLPFSLQQQRAMKAQAALAPEIQALQKKYAKDRERLSQEQMKLYKEKGINPLGGCLPMLIPWPLFIAFYQSVSSVMSTQPEQFMELSNHILPALADKVPVNVHFLWMNLSRPDPFYILPILAVITTWIQQKMMTMPSSDPQAKSMNQTMGVMMPLFMGWITLTFAAGLAIYWVAFNIIGIVQQYFTTGWGELGKMMPASILRLLPGPVPVVRTAPEPTAKQQPLPRRSLPRSTPGRDTAGTSRRRMNAAADPGRAGDEEAAPVGAATTLPSKRATRRSKGKK